MATLTTNLLSQNHHFTRTNIESTDGSVSMDSNDNFDRESLNVDNNSCCSDDTVLSVGNENPLPTENNISFKNIESHLNAISQITNSTLDPESRTKSPSSPINHRLSPSSNKSISGSPTPAFMYRNIEYLPEKSRSPESSYLNPLYRSSLCSPSSPKLCSSSPGSPESSNRSPKLPETQHFYFHQNGAKTNFSPKIINTTNNNEGNNSSLKFSIDNILKADFGRRITDPINIRKTKPKKVVPEAGKDFEEATKTGPVDLSKTETEKTAKTDCAGSQPMLWPAWVYCTRYSDRPSSGPRTRRVKKPGVKTPNASAANEEKRPRTAFSGAQLARLKHEFAENRYLTERRRQQLSAELGLNEAQIKIWFQNKRAKIKKASGQKNPLALQLMAQGLYNHSTIPLSKEEEELQEMHSSKSS